MKLKVCFNNETHRISKVPDNLESLLKLISSIFLTSLPSNYSLEYIDADGDKIMLADEQDFKEFINSEEANKSGASAAKLFIVPRKSVDQSQILSVSHSDISLSALRKRKAEEEEYQVIEGLKTSSSKAESSLVEEPVKPAVEEPVKEPEVKELIEEKQVVLEESPLQKEEPSKTEVPQVKEPEIAEQKEIQSVESGVPVEVKPEEKPLPVENKPKANNPPKKAPAQKKQAVKKTVVTKINGQNLEDLVTQAVEKNLAKIASMTQAFLQPKAQSTSQTESQAKPAPAVHRGVRCDGCRVYPIVGIRYKCSVLPDFDFCELCEQTREHPYAFIKIKFPGHTFSHMPRMMPPHPCQVMRMAGMPLMAMGPGCPARRVNNAQATASTEQANNVSQTSQPAPVVKENVVLKKETEEKPKVEVAEKIKIEEPKEVNEPEPSLVTIEDETDKVFKDGKRIVSAAFYRQSVVTKAAKLKQRLPHVNFDVLLGFVDRAPADLSLDELAENFKY